MPPLLHSTQIDDLALFSRIAAGDEMAFAALFQRYGPRLHSYFSRLARSESQAEELVQDTFIRIWVARFKLTEIRQPRHWIYRVAANEAYTWLRRRAAEARTLEQLMIPATAATGEDTLYKELKRNIAEAINALPARRRQIYLLSREEGLPQQEIADRLGISLSTVKNTLAEAVQDIRRFLTEKGLLVLAILIGGLWR